LLASAVDDCCFRWRAARRLRAALARSAIPLRGRGWLPLSRSHAATTAQGSDEPRLVGRLYASTASDSDAGVRGLELRCAERKFISRGLSHTWIYSERSPCRRYIKSKFFPLHIAVRVLSPPTVTFGISFWLKVIGPHWPDPAKKIFQFPYGRGPTLPSAKPSVQPRSKTLFPVRRAHSSPRIRCIRPCSDGKRL
jgi:hypothetical protein